MTRTRIVFSGSGGQGIITAAILLAEAAVLFESLNAVQSQDYGAEARGGATRSDVIISNAEIYFPKVTQPNILVCLTQAAYGKFRNIIRPGGILLTDSRFVTLEKKVDAHQTGLPMWETVVKEIGNPIVYNLCMLGAMVGLTEIVRPASIEKILERRLPAGVVDMNKKALALGVGLAAS